MPSNLGSCLLFQSLQKPGLSPTENEDRFAVSNDGMRFAISDGATVSVASAEWAYFLVNEHAKRSLVPLTRNRLDRIRQSWMAQVLPQNDLAWNMQLKVQEGSFATLVAVELDLQGDRWSGAIVGDSFLFHVRDNEILQRFPMSKSDEAPVLVCSTLSYDDFFFNFGIDYIGGDYYPGDRFLLSSDAIGGYITMRLQECANSNEVVDEVLTVASLSADEFEIWVRLKQLAGQLESDDASLAVLTP